MTMNIDRDWPRRRFGIFQLGMLACAFGALEERNPHVCFIRSENEPKEGEPEKGTEPTGKCGHCGMQNEDDAKFCDQCGKSLAAPKAKAEEDDPPPSSEAPSSRDPESEKASAGKSEEEGAAQPPPPKRMSATASTAAILGASADTPLAIKTAAIEMRHQRDRLLSTLAGITGKDNMNEAIGAALNIPARIAAGKKAAADLAKLQAKTDDAERWTLADRLVKTGKIERTKVLADLVDDKGKRVVDDKTGRSVRIRSKYLSMDLGVLRGMVSDLEEGEPRKRRELAEPDRKSVENARPAPEGAANIPRLVNGEPTAADIERAKTLPAVIKGGAGDPKKLDAFAREWVKTCAANSLPLGGAL